MLIRNIDNPDSDWNQFEDRLFEKLPPIDSTLKGEIQNIIGNTIVRSHMNWTVGSSCPECGSKKLTRLRTTTELIESNNGTTSLRETTPGVDDLAWWCSDCETALRLHPALNFSASPRDDEGALLPISFGDHYPTQPTGKLHDLLNGETQSQEGWSSGNRCHNCQSSSIVQISVDVEYMDSGGTTPVASGDRIGVLRYQCDNCRVSLDRHLVEPLVPEVTV